MVRRQPQAWLFKEAQGGSLTCPLNGKKTVILREENVFDTVPLHRSVNIISREIKGPIYASPVQQRLPPGRVNESLERRDPRRAKIRKEHKNCMYPSIVLPVVGNLNLPQRIRRALINDLRVHGLYRNPNQQREEKIRQEDAKRREKTERRRGRRRTQQDKTREKKKREQ